MATSQSMHQGDSSCGEYERTKERQKEGDMCSSKTKDVTGSEDFAVCCYE